MCPLQVQAGMFFYQECPDGLYPVEGGYKLATTAARFTNDLPTPHTDLQPHAYR